MGTLGDITVEKHGRADQSEARVLVYEGVNELAQADHLIGRGLPFPVLPSDRLTLAKSGDGDYVGVLCSRRFESEVHVTLLYVEPSSRRQGIARRLWEELQRDEKAQGDTLYRADVHPGNTIAKTCFLEFLFVKTFAGYARLVQPLQAL